MQSQHEELNAVLKDLKAGKTATPVTIRDFLYWFGAQRRTAANVDYINTELYKVGIRTVPGYLNIWVDTPITFELISEHSDNVEVSIDLDQGVNLGGEGDKIAGDISDAIESDPSFRIGNIPSANRSPTSVSPTDDLSVAITLMMSRNYSQLPVMTSAYEIKGIISWESIGKNALKKNVKNTVGAHMNEHYEISAAASIFSGIKIILEHGYVLVRSSDKKVSGIVTSNDVTHQFEEVSKPFLLIGEIENTLRIIIDKKLSKADIESACKAEYLPKNFAKASDLTFGNYVKILENPECWKKIGLMLDRQSFCQELGEINNIRNNIMHFDIEKPKQESLSKLTNMARMLQDILKQM
jgi:CBS domain-containing protein